MGVIFREILLADFVDNFEPLGEGRTVEIDESKFGKRKFWRGHKVEGVWVFGALEKEMGCVFMQTVEKRDAQTLISLLEKWLLLKTTVISDCWKVYNNMQNFYRLKVNHSVKFVDESTGAHTNAIESSWRHAESFSSHGQKKEHVPGNLARYMFQKSCRANNTDPTEAFF